MGALESRIAAAVLAEHPELRGLVTPKDLDAMSLQELWGFFSEHVPVEKLAPVFSKAGIRHLGGR